MSIRTAGNAHCSRVAQACLPSCAAARLPAMNFPEVLQRITLARDRAGVAYMLTGSFASAYYGFLRSTQNMDLVTAATPQQWQTLIQGYPAANTMRRGRGARSVRAGVHVQCHRFENRLEDRHDYLQIPRLQPGGVRPPAIEFARNFSLRRQR